MVWRRSRRLARLAKNHAYEILDDAVRNENGSLQLGALSRIHAGDAILAHLNPVLETLAQWEQLDKIQSAIGQKRLADRVLPSGRRAPLESARLNVSVDFTSDISVGSELAIPRLN